MKLRALLALPGPRLDVVTGEDGLDRPIRRVVTTDLLDPGRHLRGGELVLTGLGWRSGPTDSETFVRALVGAGVSGLAAGDVAFGAAPDDLVDACRRYGLPLFRIPSDVALATVTEKVVRRLAGARAAPVRGAGHDEPATYVLLLASVPDDVRRTFRVRLLDPLHTYDREHGADLVLTLETYLRYSGSWTRCAEQLHLHVNSVRYRIQRVQDLTGRDLSCLEDQVDFFLALRLG